MNNIQKYDVKQPSKSTKLTPHQASAQAIFAITGQNIKHTPPKKPFVNKTKLETESVNNDTKNLENEKHMKI